MANSEIIPQVSDVALTAIAERVGSEDNVAGAAHVISLSWRAGQNSSGPVTDWLPVIEHRTLAVTATSFWVGEFFRQDMKMSMTQKMKWMNTAIAGTPKPSVPLNKIREGQLFPLSSVASVTYELVKHQQMDDRGDGNCFAWGWIPFHLGDFDSLKFSAGDVSLHHVVIERRGEPELEFFSTNPELERFAQHFK